MRRLMLFMVLCPVLCTGCVIPAGFDRVEKLTATPSEYYWPIGKFDPLKNVSLLAVYNTGESFIVPPETAEYAWPDIYTKGPQTGSVAFLGKTAAYSIYVYDPAEGRPAEGGNGGGAIISVPAR